MTLTARQFRALRHRTRQTARRVRLLNDVFAVIGFASAILGGLWLIVQ